jgi:polar amino acid transport system substrate-binding protein
MRLLLLFFLLFPTLVTAADSMHFVYYDSYRPRSWDDNGTMRGILIDVVEEAIAQRLGIPVTHTGYPWKRAQLKVREGTADAFVSMPTQERRTYTVVGDEPVIEFGLHLITRKDHPRIKEMESITSIKQLKGYKLADYLGNAWAKRNLKEVDVKWLPQIDKLFQFVIDGRADIIVASKRTIYELKRQGYASQFKILSNTLSSVSFHLCVGKTSPYKDRLKDFDRIMREMHKDGTIDRIEEFYYSEDTK